MAAALIMEPRFADEQGPVLVVDAPPTTERAADLLDLFNHPLRQVHERAVDRLLTVLLAAGGIGRSALLLDWATSDNAAARRTVAKILLAGLPTPGAASILRFLADDEDCTVAALARAALETNVDDEREALGRRVDLVTSAV